MANYLVASGSRKISDLEIASFPIPYEGQDPSGLTPPSSSVLPLVIGDTFPITNGTSVQIQTRDFIDSLVFNASGSYTGNNTFTGSNAFTGSVNVDNSFIGLSFETPSGELYNTNIRGGLIAIQDFNNAPVIEAIRIRAKNTTGFTIENATTAFGAVISSSIIDVGPNFGNVQINRETHFSNDVYITGSLRVQEIFYVFETASILNSSGSTLFGDTTDDRHTFTGSILITGSIDIAPGGTIDGIDLSVYSQSLSAESQSFAARVTENSQSLSLLSGSYENFSGSQYNADSSSFSADITENSQSLSLLSSSYENFSGSQYNADSSSFSADITENSQSLSLLSSSYENFSGSQYNSDSSSFSADITENSQSLSLLSSSYENFSGSQYNTDSSSFSSRLSGLSTDSSSFSTRVTNNELTGSDHEERVTQNEGDISILSASFETTSSKLIDASGSFSTRVTQNTGDISILSASFETTSSKLITASGSFSTRVTQNEADILQNEGDISLLSGSFLSVSGSFSTRVTENSQSLSLLSASFETTSSKLIEGSGSFSTRVTNNELTGSDHEDRIVKGTNAITSSAVSSSLIKFDSLTDATAPSYQEGVLYYNQEVGSLSFYNEEPDITLNIGQEFYKRVKNQSGDDILNGTPVRISGSQGDMALIFPATAEDHSTTQSFENHIIGVATHDILDTETGYITELGVVRNIDTQNFSAGDILYLQTGSPATPEDYYRNTPPPFPYDIVQVGFVVRSANNGFIEVKTKEPVHFGNISGLSGSAAVPGDLWVYQENGSWTPTHNLTGSYTIGGDLLPETTEIHDLGSPSLRWKDLYLSGSTIDLGGLLIQRGADGNVQFIDSASQAPKTVTIDSITGSLDISENLSVGQAISVEGNITAFSSSGASINITTNNNSGTQESPLSTSINFLGYNGNQNGKIRVDDISGTAQVGAMEFYTWNSAEVLALRLAHTGAATVSNGLTLTAGNISLASGAGIDFSADPTGSGTSTSQLLDDYEEGTFTPVLADAATGGNVATFDALSGKYTKIGNIVYINIQAININTTGMTSGNAIYLRSIPFTSLSGNSQIGSMVASGFTFSGFLTPFLDNNTTYGRIFDSISAASGGSINVSAIASGTADLYVSLTYQV
jgi:hypothetical protein